MNILRFLRPECIDLELDVPVTEPGDEETDQQRERRLIQDKERVIQTICNLMDRSGEISNPTKFYKDMVNRERKATTAIGPGIAIPHVRSMQCRTFLMGLARSRQGLYFDSLDGKPTHLFFLLASPPYEDKLYLRVYRQFAEMLRYDYVRESLIEADDLDEVMSILRGYIVS
ncbi:MAG: PTS sugar transporter subunit IIA [Planctomycetota bacterium]